LKPAGGRIEVKLDYVGSIIANNLKCVVVTANGTSENGVNGGQGGECGKGGSVYCASSPTAVIGSNGGSVIIGGG
jgi:hypothetical protein